MTRLLSIIAALAEPTRLGAIRLLWGGQEHCVCELMQLLDATQWRMSKPGIVIDGKLVHAGGLPKTKDLAKWLKT